MQADPLQVLERVRYLANDETSPLYNAARCLMSLAVFKLAEPSITIPPEAIEHAKLLEIPTLS